MQPKNLIILSDFNLNYGTSAGVFRMNNYAKAISKVKNENIYLVSIPNFVEHDEMIKISRGIYTSIENKERNNPTGFSQIKRNFLFAKSVNRWRKINHKNAVFLIYPSVDLTFELFLLFFLKLQLGTQVFCEINEVRKYAILFKNESYISFFRWFLNLIKYSINQLLWFWYDGLICISSNIERYAKRYNKNTIVIPILSDFDGIQYDSILTKSKDDFKILFTGSISIRKENLIEFLLALVDLDLVYKNWTFDMCGFCEKSDELEIRSFLIRNNLESKVILLGVLPHDEVLKMQQNASLLVLPRENNKQNFYGFSTKLAEYAVSGTPILMTDTGVVSSFFKDNYNCFMVNGYKRKDFYEKLINILSLNNSEHKTIALNAFQTANEKFAYFRYSNMLSTFLKLNNEDTMCN